VTVYYGQDVTPEEAESACRSLREMLGDSVEVEVHNGGQSLYYYIVSVE